MASRFHPRRKRAREWIWCYFKEQSGKDKRRDVEDAIEKKAHLGQGQEMHVGLVDDAAGER